MNQKEWQRMYGTTPVSFQNRVANTLKGKLAEPSRPARRPLRVALAATLIAALMVTAALAAFSPQVADWFGRLYGPGMRQELLEGRIAQSGQSQRVGDVMYTLEDVACIDQGLYALGRISPAVEGVVLLPEDYQVTDAAGYELYDGAEAAPPAEAPSYVQLARERGARILMPSMSPESVGVDEGSLLTVGSYGYSYHPQADGSVVFMMEIPTGTAVEPGQRYELQFALANWEVTPEGESLLEGEADTWTGADWTVVVEPKPMKEEEI